MHARDCGSHRDAALKTNVGVKGSGSMENMLMVGEPSTVPLVQVIVLITELPEGSWINSSGFVGSGPGNQTECQLQDSAQIKLFSSFTVGTRINTFTVNNFNPEFSK